MDKNIINYNDMFSMSDYSKMKLQEQYDQLYQKSKIENEKLLLKKKKRDFIIFHLNSFQKT
jgi:hypothetical protein